MAAAEAPAVQSLGLIFQSAELCAQLRRLSCGRVGEEFWGEVKKCWMLRSGFWGQKVIERFASRAYIYAKTTLEIKFQPFSPVFNPMSISVKVAEGFGF